MLGLGLGLNRLRSILNAAPVLSNFVDNLAQNPPNVAFDSDTAGTCTWDFHSSATPPSAGAGDIGTGSFAVTAGGNQATLDLNPYSGQTGYLHFRVAGSNVLTSQQITAASDVTAPTANSYSPADNAVDVADNSTLSITWSEAMDTTAVTTVTLKNVGGSTIETFDSSIDGAWSAGDTVWTVAPTSTFTAGANLAVQYSGFTDVAGNAAANVANDTTWNFDVAGGETVVLDFGDLTTSDVQTGVTVTADTITCTAQAGNQTPFIRWNTQSVTAPGNYTIIFDVDSITADFNNVLVFTRFMDTANGTEYANFNVATESVDSKSAGLVTRIAAKTGGLYTCEVDFSVTSDGVGNYEIGPTTLTNNAYRVTDPNGTEAVTISNFRVIER